MFARESGVPIIYEVAAPAGPDKTITFVSASGYTFEDALSILNLNLLRFGVHLRRQDQYLYLNTIQDAMKKPTPVAKPGDLAALTPDQIITVSIPLDNARAETVTEQVKTMVGPYGGVLAVPTQNMVIVVETAAQVKRIREIIGAIDSVKPADSAYRLFPLKNTQADVVVAALKGLVGERTKTVIVDPDGKQRVVQDLQVAGLSLAADVRTNSVIAVGPAAKIRTVEELIGLLDTPDGTATAEGQMMTFTLGAISPEEAAKQLTALFANADPKSKPLVLPLSGGNKVTVVGPKPLLAKASALLGEIDPTSGTDKPAPRTERRAAIVKLKNITPQMIEGLAPRLLTPRQMGTVKFAASPDGKGLVIAGGEGDVTAFEELVTALDVPAEMDKDVRMVRVAKGDAAGVLKRARELYDQTGKSEREPVLASLDAPSATITLIGGKNAIAAFAQLLASSEQAGAVDLEARRFVLTQVKPSALAAKLGRVCRPLLAPTDGSAYSEPSFDPVDELNTLVVRATPAQFQVLAGLVTQMEAQEAGGQEFRVVRLNAADPQAVLEQAKKLYADRTAGMTPEQAGPVSAELDAKSGAVLMTARPAAVKIFSDVLTQVQQLAEPAVEVRVFKLASGDATTVGPAVTSAIKAQGASGEPPATVSVEPASNTVVVVGTPAQVGRAAKLVESMDTAVDKGGLGVRTFTLKNGRAETIAPVLQSVLTRESALDRLPEWMRAQAIARGAVERLQVRVAAEPRLNALVVSGPRAIIDVAEQVVTELDIDPVEKSDQRVVRVVTLQNSDAASLAASLTAVFADVQGKDPAPLIRVDQPSNSLIVRATPMQMAQLDELTKKLDAATVASSRQMRTVNVDRSRVDAEVLAQTLKKLMEQQGGVKVEVISAEDLLKKEGAKQGKQDEPAAAPKKVGMLDAPATERGSRSHGIGISRCVLEAIGILAVAAFEPDPAAPVQPPLKADESDAAGVTIAVDKASNTIMIVGSPRATDRLAGLAAELQQQMPAQVTGVRMVTLPASVDGAAVANVVRQTVAQVGTASASNPGGFTGPVTIMQDPGGSALIVLANDTDFETVGKLIGSVSQLKAAVPATVKIYPLTAVSAGRAIQSIRDLFTPEPSGWQARRVRQVELTIPGANGTVTARVDPSSVKMTADPGGTSVIVAAPLEAIPLIDRLIETIDQSPVKDRLAIRRYDLKNARSQELSQTLQALFDAQRQGAGGNDLPQARFVADARTNSMLVTASGPQHADIARLLETADASVESADSELAIITLQQASALAVQRIVEEVVVGRDPAKKDRVRISAQDGSSLFVVRAPKADLAQVREIVAQVDSAQTGGLPVRSIKLERADAGVVAQALTKFFTDRAAVSARPGVRATNRVAVVGDKRTGTLVVSASDEDFAQVDSLVKTFDTPTPSQDFQFKVVPLKNAHVADIATTIKDAIDEMRWESVFGGSGDNQGDHKLYVQSNERTNSIVLIGQGEGIGAAERVIAALDVPEASRAATVLKSVVVKNADVQALRSVLQRAFTNPNWRPWRGQDPDAIVVEIDKGRHAVILVGKSDRVDQALAYVKELDGSTGAGALKIDAITLAHAKADRASQSLKQFFTDRAKAQGVDTSPVSIIGSADGNVLIVSADEDNLKILRDLVAQIDQPDGGKDRRVEVFVLKNGVAKDTADALRSMFARNGKAEDQVIITPQPSTNSLILSAPAATFEDVLALLRQLDAAPKGEEANIETVALNSARASDVAAALKSAMPPNVKVTVTPVARSNSLLLTGSKEAIALVMDQVKKLDTEPVRSGLVFRRFKIGNAEASEVSYTVEQMLRARPKGVNEPAASIDYSRTDNTITVYAPADQIEEIDKIVRELDQPVGEDRTTEFVKLEYAKAEATAAALRTFYGRYAPEATTPGARNVTIISDNVSNSLVIRADKTQWEGIRSLLSKLDTKEYDTARQLAVIPLEHADAASVARALNDGLRAPLEEQLRQAQARSAAAMRGQQGPRPQTPEPTVLIDAGGLPTVSAEPQTNSIIVFAAGPDLKRIQDIVRQLDVSGFADMPAARIIPLKNGKPSVVANNIRQLYLNKDVNQKVNGPKAVLVIGDDASGALIVRADDEKFAQIRALAETLEQQGQIGRVAPHVVKLKNVAAGKLRQTLLATFMDTAKAQGETLAIEIDRTSNSLVIASSARLLEEIQKVIDELDAANLPAPDPNKAGDQSAISQSVTIIDVVNNAPADIKKILDDMGLSKPQAPDRPGVVSDAITIVPMSSRRALAIVASPADGRAVEALVKALDAEPVDAQQQIAIIPLKMATAKPLVDTLSAMLKPTDPASQAGATGPAKALAEQIRRLALSKNGVDHGPTNVDLAKPIRLIADADANAVIIASTQANIDALRDIVKLLDTLPIGDAVVVRIFMLENASATRVKQVVDQLFSQGEQLRRLPGTKRQGLPPTTTGQALAGDIAVAVDERTNAMIVAGREEAVALVEVMVKDLDSDRASKWVEPAIIQLKHADASTLAKKLDSVLVKGLTATPESLGLQKQFGRLRMVQEGKNASDPGATVAADLFAPLTGLVITADDNLNALLVIGTPANNTIVRQLVAMLDVEAASAANTVRVYPLQYAASERVVGVIRDIFRQREQSPDTRPEDRLVISSDVRTNSVIASSSGKSFAILEGLIKTLDGEKSNFSVGLHILPVTGADVKTLAPRIDRLMRERIAAAAQTGSIRNPLDAFSIEPEGNSNVLIVACSDENLQVVKELVVALSANADALAKGERMDIIQLNKARAAEVSQSLTSLYVDRENARRGTNAVSVAPNERLNAVIINGNEQDMIELRALARKLDSAEVAARQQIKWIELKSANAPEVVRLLQSVLAGRPMGGGTGVAARQATRVQFLRDKLASTLAGPTGRPPTEADIDGAIKDQVTLTPDARTNSVWITAPEPVVTLLTEMIQDIEASSAGSRKIEQFKLLNADARQMAEVLKDIFNLRQQGSSLVLVPVHQQDTQNPQGGAAPAVGPPTPEGLDSGAVTAVPDERQQLAIAVDPRTNTLIVSGTPDYLDLVRKVVTELDGIEANERERRVYSLRNAKAKEIETTLKNYFRNESDLERTTLSGQYAGSLMRRLEEEVTVVGDEKSNKLVISTSPRYMNAVLSIVDELDAAPPQVMIQVLLAEVTLDNTETWGMDVNVGPFGGDGYRVGSTAAGVGVATALGVPNLSVSSADFGVLIRSLEEQGKLEVLSNPQVMVNNNQNAKIQVGENVAVVNGVERTSQGNSFADVIRQDVGIILNVVPSISTDGFVRMDIKPEISQLSAKTTQVSADVLSPIITKRAVDTVVTVKDGQSVVIGGLIQTSEEQRRTKVPILGDIPIIGLPFRTKKDTNVKTELLVILTPRVIPGQAGVAEAMISNVTEQSVDRLEDPSKVEDYLERVRQEVQRRHMQGAPAPSDGPPPSAGPDPEAPADPGPGRASDEHSTLIPDTNPRQAASPRGGRPTMIQDPPALSSPQSRTPR